MSSSSSEDVELVIAVDVVLSDGMIMEVTLLELELAAAEDDFDEDDCVVVVVVVGPMEALLPGMRLR